MSDQVVGEHSIVWLGNIGSAKAEGRRVEMMDMIRRWSRGGGIGYAVLLGAKLKLCCFWVRCGILDAQLVSYNHRPRAMLWTCERARLTFIPDDNDIEAVEIKWDRPTLAVSDIIADIQTLRVFSLPPKALLPSPFLNSQPYSGPCSFSWGSYIKPTRLNSIHDFVNDWPPVTGARCFAHANCQHGWVVYFRHHCLQFYLQGP